MGAYTIAGQPYDQAGFDFVLDYTNRLGYATVEQFVQAQIAFGLDTQAFAYAQLQEFGGQPSAMPAQQATQDMTMVMAPMTQMMQVF